MFTVDQSFPVCRKIKELDGNNFDEVKTRLLSYIQNKKVDAGRFYIGYKEKGGPRKILQMVEVSNGHTYTYEE